MPKEAQQAVFSMGHGLAGFLILNGNFVNIFEAEAMTAGNEFGTPSMIIGIAAAGIQGSVDYLLSRRPIRNEVVGYVGKITTALVVLCKIAFCGFVQGRLAKGGGGKLSKLLAVVDGRRNWGHC